ncbi:MAG: PD40 domain-containing protein, partial [Deltaproteobacteria bacterium]|nr:PD40 domain-containing protein [Deltaproteobacteria bacterium]
GGMFMDYLRTRLGEAVIFEMCHQYAAKPVPYGLNRLFLEVTGVPLKTLYDDFTRDTLARAQSVRDQVQAAGETASDRLTFTGENKGDALVERDGTLIIPISDGLERSAIFSYPADAVGDDARRTKLALSSSAASISLDDAGNLFYVRPAPFRENYRYRDLFVLRKGERDAEQLTEGARIKDAAVSPTGNEVALVTNAAGITRLEMMNVSDGARRLLIPENDDWHYYAPRFSPDGKTLAFIWRKKGRVDVALMDLATGHTFFVTGDDAIEEGVTFSPDGRYLLFVSGVTGITNIFARDMASGALKQVTNVVSGAMSPVLAPDGRTLYFLKYYSEGWDLHRTVVDLDGLPLFIPPFDRTVTPRSLHAVQTTSSPYNPLPTFRPYSWELSLKNTGGQRILDIGTYIEDAARLHAMNLRYNYELNSRRPVFAASYSYSGLLPRFQLSFSYSQEAVNTGYLVGGTPAPWTRESFGGEIGFSIPVMGLDANHSLSAGYSLDFNAPVETLEVVVDPNGELPEMPTQNFRTGIRVGWSYSDVFSGPFSISREDGRSLSFGVRLYHPALGGNREQAVFYWDWREYRQVPFARHHALALELAGQAYISNPNHQASFTAGGYSTQDVLDAVINGTSMGLPMIRGYAREFASGDHYQSLRLEYRFPIWQAQLAYETLPFFFDRVYGAVFSDNLLISYTQFTMEDFYSSLGMELVWSFDLGYYMPILLRTGYAHGLMDKGNNEFILLLGGSF